MTLTRIRRNLVSRSPLALAGSLLECGDPHRFGLFSWCLWGGAHKGSKAAKIAALQKGPRRERALTASARKNVLVPRGGALWWGAGWAAALLLATGLVFCHGCHDDEDNELSVPGWKVQQPDRKTGWEEKKNGTRINADSRGSDPRQAA